MKIFFSAFKREYLNIVKLGLMLLAKSIMPYLNEDLICKHLTKFIKLCSSITLGKNMLNPKKSLSLPLFLSFFAD